MGTRPLAVTYMRTEGLEAPLGLGAGAPQFTWEVDAGEPGEIVGFQIQVGRHRLDLEAGEADLWESGTVLSTKAMAQYAGPQLASRSEFWWRVRAADIHGLGPWSEPAHAELGLLEISDWTADWITHPAWTDGPSPAACPVLATTFTTASEVRWGRLYVTGLGVYVVDIDGIPVDDATLEPGTSDYAIRVAARALRVSHLLAPGQHRITVRLGEGSAHIRDVPGRYTKFTGRRRLPAALVQLELEFVDGSSRRIVSDSTWWATLGATRLAHWYGGEDYDARLDPRFLGVDAEWQRVVVVDSAATGPRPWWRSAPPVRVQQTLDPRSVTVIAESEGAATLVADFGVNIAGRPTVALDSRVGSGTRLTLHPAEHIGAGGGVDQASVGAPVFDTYIARGGGESWRPEFCYHGFRYLQIDGPTALVTTPDAFIFRAEVLHTDDATVGSFAAGDPRLDKLYGLILRAMTSNLFSMPTDCPHREKLGWLEQLHLVFGPLSHAFDVQAHFRDVVTHMIDAQTADGLIPDIAPELVVFEGGFRSDAHWGAAILELPWRLYVAYDDMRPLTAAWAAGVRYLDYLAGLSCGAMLDHGLGDWKALDDSTPRALVAGHGHVHLLDTARRVAHLLGMTDAVTSYAVEATTRRAALSDAFVDPGTGVCGSGSQTSYALALDVGLVDEQLRSRCLGQLITGIESTGYQITVGEIALPALLRVLGAAGRHDVIYRMVTQTAGPGYGRMLENGSTSLAEVWDDSGRRHSANHFMLGAIGDWLVGDVAGISQAPGSTGWDRVRFAPVLLDGLPSAAAAHRSRHGLTSVEWARSESALRVTVVVPTGSLATLHLPRLTGHEVADCAGLETTDSGTATFDFLVPPGRWTVTTTVPAGRRGCA